LIGTVVLPAAITLTVVMIVKTILVPPQQFADAIPLLMLAMVLLLPGFLILITSRKLIYVVWMFIYLFSLPVWNFLLPLYAFSKMDDFSWGETRKVIGDRKGDHADVVGESLASLVPLKRWEEWERFRNRKMRREARRATGLASTVPSTYGQEFYAADSEGNLRVAEIPLLPTASRFPSTILSRSSPFEDSPISPPPPSHAFESPEEFVPVNEGRMPIASRLFVDDLSLRGAKSAGNSTIYTTSSSLLAPPPMFRSGSGSTSSSPVFSPYGSAPDLSMLEPTESYSLDEERLPLRTSASPMARR